MCSGPRFVMAKLELKSSIDFIIIDELILRGIPSLYHSNSNGGSPSMTAQVTEALLPDESVPKNLNGFNSGRLQTRIK